MTKAVGSRRKRVDVATLQRLQLTLRKAGLRSTAARVKVLHVLEEALRNGRPPLSHNDVADCLKSGFFDRATIYRNLMDLTEAGLATRVDMGDHIWRFLRLDHPQDTAHACRHPHFVCRLCGTVSCLAESDVLIKTTSPMLKARDIEVQIRGTCADCAR